MDRRDPKREGVYSQDREGFLERRGATNHTPWHASMQHEKSGHSQWLETLISWKELKVTWKDSPRLPSFIQYFYILERTYGSGMSWKVLSKIFMECKTWISFKDLLKIFSCHLLKIFQRYPWSEIHRYHSIIFKSMYLSNIKIF